MQKKYAEEKKQKRKQENVIEKWRNRKKGINK
jgi:hypothetical protein